MFVNSDSGLRFEVTFRGKEEFGPTYEEILGKAWILADSDKHITLDIKCFKMNKLVQVRELLVELYIDGILRNVTKSRTGRGLAEFQIAEATIDRGVVLSEDGTPLLKKFRFSELDIDDAVLNSRLVEEAGIIEVRIIQAGLPFNEEDDISFQLPNVINDRGAVSLFCGEINNTVGVRFDEGQESVRDTKEIRLKTSVDLMVERQNRMLGATLAIFSFIYASDAILLHLGMIPPGHKRYDENMASERLDVRTTMSHALLNRGIYDSDYTLTARIGELNMLNDDPPEIEVLANKSRIILPIRSHSLLPEGSRRPSMQSNPPPRTPSKQRVNRQAKSRLISAVREEEIEVPMAKTEIEKSDTESSEFDDEYHLFKLQRIKQRLDVESVELEKQNTGCAELSKNMAIKFGRGTAAGEMQYEREITYDRVINKKRKSSCTSPQRKTSRPRLPRTPPNTPIAQKTVVYDMTQYDDEVVEIKCVDYI